MNRSLQPKRTLIWRGETPDGYSLIIEREATGHWTAIVAAALRSRNTSLEAAINEVAGPTAPRAWATTLAAALGKSRPCDEPAHE